MMMTSEYEGGIGGKIRKRALRRKIPSTPYDSPPLATEVGGSCGWFSKLIDPAARLIVRSASFLFSSIFSKNSSTNEEILEIKSSHEVREQEQGDNFVDIKLSFHYDGMDISEQNLSSRLDTLFQLEHLVLSQKSLSKVEVDRLAGLVHSRIIEPTNLLSGGYHSKPPKAPFCTLDLNSGVRLPVSPVDSVNKCMIRQPRGRLGSDKFSGSPYCKLFRTTNVKENNLCKGFNFDITRPLKLTRPSLSNIIRRYCHEQALKRRRSDQNAGCFGDHERRRVRQKSRFHDFNLSTDAYREGIDLKGGLDNQDCRIPSATSILYAPPPRSVEMARKILQHLDQQ